MEISMDTQLGVMGPEELYLPRVLVPRRRQTVLTKSIVATHHHVPALPIVTMLLVSLVI